MNSIQFTKNGTILTGNIAKIKNEWQKGKVSTRFYCMAFQIVAYGNVSTNDQKFLKAVQEALKC
jgi:hypothetical protein